jgi:predicted CXXCH cytochrome family protein
MPLTDYRIDYQFNSPSDQMTVVGHFEQLRQSACYQKSSDMSCVTCHDPHVRQKPKDLTTFYRDKCLKCHTVEACVLELGQRLKKDPTDNCKACHMPRGGTEIPHVAFTHHRIGRHSSHPQPVPGNLGDLVAIEDNPRLTEIDRKRSLGLAYVQAAFRAPDRDRAFACGKRARDLLESVYQAGLRDETTLRNLVLIHRQEANPPLARRYAQELLDTKDPSMDAQVDALRILIEAHLADHEVEQALVLLKKLTRLRRTAEDWGRLGTCYLETNQIDRALEAFEKALGIDPFDHRIHVGVAEAYRRRGDFPRAREHDQKAQWLAQRAKS